jgi:DNA repair protein RadC
MDYLSIKKWAAEDRPREKLLLHGSSVLSDAELLAIIIGSGTRELSALELARTILAQNGNNLSNLGKVSIKELTRIKGIGEAKAISIAAAVELARRRNNLPPEIKSKITNSSAAAALFQNQLTDLKHEEFWIAYLNRANLLIKKKRLSQGGISGTVIDVRLILKIAIEHLASSIILCHNHPSGNLNHSEQDVQITKKIKEAAKLFDINLLDHIIVAGDKYFSFADEGLI